MNLSFLAGCLWIVLANVIGALPSRDHHWRAAYLLIGLGIPLLGWITLRNGPVVGLLFLAAGMSILRWPMIYLWRALRRKRSGRA